MACDGVISLTDYSKFQKALTGPGERAEFPLFDTDEDRDIDLFDFGAFQVDYTGE